MSKWLFRLLHFSRRIWVRTTLIALLALVAAAISPVIGPFLPDKIAVSIDLDALKSLLNVLLNTMLTVTTFSLSVITGAHLTASSSVTPRIHRLLRENGSAQNVIATFLGAFIYALVTLVMLNLHIHEKDSYGTVYIFTLGVIALIIIALLRWIQHLTTIGAMDSSIANAARTTERALDDWRGDPWLGGCRAIRPAPSDATELTSDAFGYLQTIDLPALDRIVRQSGGEMWLLVRPGDYLSAGKPIALLTGGLEKTDQAALRSAMVLGEMRTWDYDPGFGLIVLSEIASRALSPGINDPRTAEAVAIQLHRLIARAADRPEPPRPRYPWLTVPDLPADTMIRMAFDPIARDGKAFIEVMLALQKIYAQLALSPDPDFATAARAASHRALAHAEKGLELAEDLEYVREAAPR